MWIIKQDCHGNTRQRMYLVTNIAFKKIKLGATYGIVNYKILFILLSCHIPVGTMPAVTKEYIVQPHAVLIFFLYCFWWTTGPFYVFILFCRPSKEAYNEVSFQMAAHLRTGCSLEAGKIARFKPGTVKF